MTTSARSYLTAGIATLGASAIALTPVAPSQTLAIVEQRTSALAVELASSIDPITPWINTVEGAFENIAGIITAGLANPLPIIRQVIANQITYISEFPDIGLILGQIIGNIGNAVTWPLAVPVSCSDQENFGPCENVNSTVPVIIDSPLGDLTQQAVFAVLPLVLGDQYAAVKPILDFTTTPLSGALLSLIGPVVGPVLSLVNSVGAIVGALGQGDFIGAINELINIPANFTNALLNGGQFLDLTPVLSLVGVTLPDSIQSIGFNMGGLLSQGGVMFDGLAFNAALGPFAVTDPGLPVGPIGTLLGLNDYFARAIAVTPPTQSAKRVAPAAADAAAEAAPAVEVAAEEAPVAPPEDSAAGTEAPEDAPAVSASRSDEAPVSKREQHRAGRGPEKATAADTDAAPQRPARAAAERRAG